PSLGLCQRIVDLVSTGNTLKANNLIEIEHIADVSSRLIVNRTALKTRPDVGEWINKFSEAINGA
ncbi:MAG: ATP phosphoribosyltransferase, partial [Alphaproteobacteria bacterium]